MAAPRRVRLQRASYDHSTGKITVRPILSYLKEQPLAVAELTDDEALGLAESLIRAVQNKLTLERRDSS